MANLIDKVKVKMGRLVRVWNTKKKPAANKIYVAVQVEDANGKNERCLLFTENEVKRATERAKKNIEDLTKKEYFTDLVD